MITIGLQIYPRPGILLLPRYENDILKIGCLAKAPMIGWSEWLKTKITSRYLCHLCKIFEMRKMRLFCNIFFSVALASERRVSSVSLIFLDFVINKFD